MKSLILGLTILLASFSGSVNEKEKTTVEEFVCSEWVEMDMTLLKAVIVVITFGYALMGKPLTNFYTKLGIFLKIDVNYFFVCKN